MVNRKIKPKDYSISGHHLIFLLYQASSQLNNFTHIRQAIIIVETMKYVYFYVISMVSI